MKGIIDKTVAIVLAVDSNPKSIVGFDVTIFSLQDSREEEEERILNRAIDRIKTEKGFHKFIDWFKPKENEDAFDRKFEPRTEWWDIGKSMIPETIERVYIKNLRKISYSAHMDRMTSTEMPTTISWVLAEGSWAYIKNDKVCASSYRKGGK